MANKGTAYCRERTVGYYVAFPLNYWPTESRMHWWRRRCLIGLYWTALRNGLWLTGKRKWILRPPQPDNENPYENVGSVGVKQQGRRLWEKEALVASR